MMDAWSQMVMVIPSLEPDERLPAYAAQLLENGFEHIVVVDDGSSSAAQPIFERIAALPGCTVLHHPVNRGKGAALKTAYAWILENMPRCEGVLTADADGQHTVADCIRLAQALKRDGSPLYLGSRDFSLPQVPAKSRKGNRITSAVFKALYGVYLPDTQTGLRAFSRAHLPMMAQVAGDRYEYEMNVLIACARGKIPMVPITIETVYENNNEGTHFHPVRDSWRIYRVILGGFFRFMSASLVCFLVDQALFNLLRGWLFPLLGISLDLSLPLGLHLDNTSLANYMARLISAALNFRLNKDLVFRVKGAKGALGRYAVTAVCVVILSTLGIKALGLLGVAPPVAKPICDCILYFLSYRVQQRWVFAERKEGAA